MKQVFALFFCCLVLSCTAQQKKQLIPFQKLVGNWIMEKNDGTIMGETWIKKNDKELRGQSFMIQNGDTTILEIVDLVKKGNDIFYIPVAYGQNDDKPVSFKLTTIKATAYFFENPAHDFPKRIVYDFTGSNTLHAYIDDGTDKKRQHYYYKKKK
jgi:hypothetical protein